MGSRKVAKKLTNASDVLHRLFTESKSPLSAQFLRWQVWQNWEQIVGPQIAERTCPVGYQRGVLYVWVQDSASMQHMIFIAKNIADKVNEYLEKKWVFQVRFTLDRKFAAKPGEIQLDQCKFLSK